MTETKLKALQEKWITHETLTVNSNGDVSQEQIKEGMVPLIDETGWVVGRMEESMFIWKNNDQRP